MYKTAKRFMTDIEMFYNQINTTDNGCPSKRLFNPFVRDENKLVCGTTTNIINIAKPKYPFFIDLVFRAYSNNWLPQKVGNMAQDKYDYYNNLTDDEKAVYKTILSFLIFLDSVQTNNLPNIANYVTSPEIVFFLARQAYDEAIHSYSYSYIGNAIMPIEEFNEVVYEWRNNRLLLERNKFIAGLYDIYKDKNDKKSFLILLVGNLLLEGVYFYNGFNFFHNLASRGLMIGTNTQIKYIRRDEAVHCIAFTEMLKIFREENSDDFDIDLIYTLFKEAVSYEIEFSKATIGSRAILGINEQSIEDYTYYIANKRLRAIGLDGIFPDRPNPYRHLDRVASVDDKESENKNKDNNFETTSIAYKDPYAIFKDFGDVDSWF